MNSTAPSAANEQPLVTVVTASYNLIRTGRQNHIRECIESVHNQTYSNIEHLVIDGASSDGTLTFLQEYEAKGWLKVYSEPDTGIYDAFNKGLQRARGKYIAFLNSDDYWHDKRGIEHSVHALEISQADFSYAPTRRVDQDSNDLGVIHYNPFAWFYRVTPFCHQAMLCRTELIRATGGFDTRFRIAGDYDSFLRIVLRGGRCVSIPTCFTSFRMGGLSTNDSAYDIRKAELCDIYRRVYFPYLKEEDIEPLYYGNPPTAELRNVLSQMVHPSIYLEFENYFKWHQQKKRKILARWNRLKQLLGF